MNVTRSNVGVSAMSLIELLCVMAIIALLAALLLPALGQAKARARRIQCIDHLHQTGVGFVNFANDHNGQFPMAVPVSAGGSLEFARSGYLLQGEFHFSFRHFQVTSNELVTPKLVVCPADTRLPATSFATLSNANLSYFIGVNAEFARPTSILAGDRNLTNDYTTPGSLVRLGPNYALRWTDELHRFKGNLLFSDGHVEEKNNPALASTGGQVPAVANLALPTVRQPGTAAPSPGGSSSPGTPGTSSAPGVPNSGSSAPAASAKALTGANSVIRPGGSVTPQWVPAMPAGGASAQTPSPPRVEKRSTNTAAASTPPKPEEEDASFSRFELWLAAATEGLAEKGLWWFCALLLLIVASILVLRRLARGRKKRLSSLRPGFTASARRKSAAECPSPASPSRRL
jgi:prepilin-type N-terminal cleavage/methylation domain-containing protein/prepilin-type processing-associated H-X9-DG protein